MVSAPQLRAARGFLGWSQSELAARTALSPQTIKRMELKGTDASTVANVRAVKQALEAAGCTFLTDDGSGEGVRCKFPTVQTGSATE